MYRLFLSLRYLRTRKTAVLAVLAVSFGVATLLTVLSIMEGYIVELREMIRDQDAHMVVHSAGPRGICDVDTVQETLLATPHVVATAPTTETFAMYRSDRFSPVLLRGIDPLSEVRVTDVGRYFLRPEELDSILATLDGEGDTEGGLPGAAATLGEAEARKQRASDAARDLIRDESRAPLSADEIDALFSLAHRRRIIASLPEALRERFDADRGRIPSSIVVGVPFLTGRSLFLGQMVKIVTVAQGSSELVEGNFLVAGAFKTGNFELDSQMFFVDNRRLATFLRSFSPLTGDLCFQTIRVSLDDYTHARKARGEMERALLELPPETGARVVRIYTWEEQKRGFLEAVEWEKWLTAVVISFLNIFTACVILLMLVLLVIEKRRDSGILLAIGSTPGGVFSIFLINGLVITALGTALGLGLGVLFVENINTVHDWIRDATGYQLFDPEVYLMDRIPTVVKPLDTLASTLPALLFGFLASLVPAAWAARQDPIKAIHHE